SRVKFRQEPDTLPTREVARPDWARAREHRRAPRTRPCPRHLFRPRRRATLPCTWQGRRRVPAEDPLLADPRGRSPKDLQARAADTGSWAESLSRRLDLMERLISATPSYERCSSTTKFATFSANM